MDLEQQDTNPEPAAPGRQYRIPEDEYLDPDEARDRIKEIHSDCLADSSHPYVNNKSPLHENYMKYVTSLHEAASSDAVNPYEKVLAEYEDKEAGRLETLRADAQKDLEKLIAADLEPDTVLPEDITEQKCLGLKMRALNLSEKPEDRAELTRLLRDGLKNSPSSQRIQQLFDSFVQVNDELDPEFHRSICDELIFYLDKAGVKIKPKNPKTMYGI